MVENLNSFNIIIADIDLETFKKVEKLNERFNLVNLSSDFAVNFILEYEKIDLIIISNKIPKLENIKNHAKRKNINVYVIGEDLRSPLDIKEIDEILNKELKAKLKRSNKNKFNLKKFLGSFLGPKRIKNRTEEYSSRLDVKKNGGTKNRNQKDTGKNGISPNLSLSTKRSIKNEPVESSREKSKSFIEKKESIERPDINYLKKQKDDFELKKFKTIKQKIIIIAKAKGGVGSTTLAIFLGSIFNKFKTLLIDLNFSEGGGDIGYYLGIPGIPNILNFTEGYNREALNNSVISIRENLDVLQMPPTYEMSKKIDLQDIYCLADVAKKKYHLIIFDLPNQLDDLWLGIIDLADLLIMVSDHTMGSIGRLLKMNNKFIYNDLDKILILNKYQKANDIHLIRNQIHQFFDLNDYILIKEDELLRSKTEFSDLNFNNITSLNNLMKKIFNLLSCD